MGPKIVLQLGDVISKTNSAGGKWIKVDKGDSRLMVDDMLSMIEQVNWIFS